MDIVIKPENEEKITKAIHEVQKKARERRCDFQDLTEAIKEIEHKLRLSKAALNGTTAIINLYAGHFPRAYKYTPYGTCFNVKFSYGTWKLVSVYRDNVKDKHNYMVKLTEKAEKALIKRNPDNWQNCNIHIVKELKTKSKNKENCGGVYLRKLVKALGEYAKAHEECEEWRRNHAN